MKTKFSWIALLASAAMIAQANAGGHHGGGGSSAPSFSGRAASPSFHSGAGRSFGGGRMIYSGQRFSAMGMRSPTSTSFRQRYINSSDASLRARQFTPGNIYRGNHVTRFSNNGNRTVTNSRRQFNRTGQVRNGNNLPGNWRSHVVAQRSANWHRDWDRGRDHSWHGHHCRFINGAWFVFDSGFDPWWYYGYPYDYYADDYYPYSDSYDEGVYQGREAYDQNGYADQSANSTIAIAQKRLAQQGYYRGDIDGILGPETRRAITRYQSNHGLRVTGYLTTDTLQALGLQRVASY